MVKHHHQREFAGHMKLFHAEAVHLRHLEFPHLRLVPFHTSSFASAKLTKPVDNSISVRHLCLLPRICGTRDGCKGFCANLHFDIRKLPFAYFLNFLSALRIRQKGSLPISLAFGRCRNGQKTALEPLTSPLANRNHRACRH